MSNNNPLSTKRIPKTIHYTWFSNDPFPPMVKICLESWKVFLPDYEFVHWDMAKISGIDNRFLREALEKKKWAFAADFVRVYALYHHGGIYLDTDVEVYKSFDPLLNCEAFIGKENSHPLDRRRATRYLTSHCMGAVKQHPYFKACLEYYSGRPFILSNEDWLPDNLKFDQTILPYIQYSIAKLQGYNPSERLKGIQTLTNGLEIFPYQYFDCLYKVRKAYCRHLALGGWRGEGTKKLDYLRDKAKKRLYVAINNVLGLANVVFYKKI